jgi:predicted O-methyltransferase YrrM
MERFANDRRVRIYRSSSRDAAAEFTDDTFDWIYLDGDHSYEAVLNDLITWRPKVRRGGVLAGDDLNWRDEKGTRSVRLAVATFITKECLKVESLPAGQFMIRL